MGINALSSHLCQPWRDITSSWGATITSDGTDDVTNRPILNFVAVNWSGACFISSVDTSGETKDADFLSKKVTTVIRKFGSEDVRAVVMDGAAANVSSSTLIKETNPGVLVKCAAHGVDLLLKDMCGGGEKKKIARLGYFRRLNKLLATVKALIRVIRNSGALLAKLRTGGKNLIVPVETRFASLFYTLERISVLEQILGEVVASSEWRTVVRAAKPGKVKVMKHIKVIICIHRTMNCV
jgi:hypothetical protein